MERRTESHPNEMSRCRFGDEKITLLLDFYDDEAKKLHASFLAAGRHPFTVVINGDGFLPDTAVSPYEYFLGDFASDSRLKGTPLYFNEVQLPDYWKIKATGSSAEIFDRTDKRGIIHYTEDSAGTNKRLVKAVEWMDRANVVRSCDHYNRYGALYARTSYSAEGQPILKTYFSADGREVIYENLITKTIFLAEHLPEKEIFHFFENKASFVCYFLRKVGLERNTIYYNSLSTPLFVTMKLTDRPCEDVLFWQEAPRDDIPGNMQMILENKLLTTKIIYVQNRVSYEKLLKAGANPDKLKLLGFVYPFQKENHHSNQVLICTNSDQVEQLSQLVSALPEMCFHIAAKTEMSDKLLAVGRYDNVFLYPVAEEQTFRDLFMLCDWYLDINHGSEVMSADKQAFLHNQLILGFFETIHNTALIPPEHICSAEHPEMLMLALKTMLSDPDILETELKRQRSFGMSEQPEAYQIL